MSLDKAIKYGKEHRKEYTGSKAYFTSCRNHGSCPFCRRDRLHKFRDKHPNDFWSHGVTSSTSDFDSDSDGSTPSATASFETEGI